MEIKDADYMKGKTAGKHAIFKDDVDSAFDKYEYNEQRVANGSPNTWNYSYTMGYLDAISEYYTNQIEWCKKEKEDIERLIDALRLERLSEENNEDGRTDEK